MKKVAIIGAGGMGREVACVINRINQKDSQPEWNLIGFYDDNLAKGTYNEFGTILGNVNSINEINDTLYAVIAIGNPKIILNIRNKIKNKHVYFPNIIDPSVEFWDKEHIKIGIGNIICPNCSLSCNVKLGDFNLLNGDVSIRHDVVIGNYNALMPGVRISGGVNVGNLNFFGLNSAVIQYKTIGNFVRVGAASIIMKDAIISGLYTGIPACLKTINN